jgi:hypothetical protein
MTEFPILDAPRYWANCEHHRVILDFHGYFEAYVDEMDSWVAMPVRLVHTTTGGFALEVGPYTLDAADIRVMQAAIASYCLATERPPIKAVD